MAIANPRIHMICGICGCNKMLKFTVKDQEDCDENGLYRFNQVTIICENCSSITTLDELIEEENGQRNYIETKN
jgi:hypothetical protein